MKLFLASLLLAVNVVLGATNLDFLLVTGSVFSVLGLAGSMLGSYCSISLMMNIMNDWETK